jgi:hypothetical protein
MKKIWIISFSILGLFSLINTGMMHELIKQGPDVTNGYGYDDLGKLVQAEAPPIITEHNVSTAWIPDGIVNENEYSKSVVLAGEKRGRPTGKNLEVYWKNDAQNFYMALKGLTSGWVAIGFEPSFAMKDADIIMGTVNASNVTILDEYCIDNYGPHLSDKELGGANNILAAGGKYDGNFTTIEFERKMNTGDKFDKAFIPGQKITIIWAMADSDSLKAIHDGAQGTGELTWE